jgi:hypothetical protein
LYSRTSGKWYVRCCVKGHRPLIADADRIFPPLARPTSEASLICERKVIDAVCPEAQEVSLVDCHTKSSKPTTISRQTANIQEDLLESMRPFRLHWPAAKPCRGQNAKERFLRRTPAQDAVHPNVDSTTCCLTDESQNSATRTSWTSGTEQMACYDCLVMDLSCREHPPQATNKSALSHLMNTLFSTQFNDDIEEACGTIQRHIIAERYRQKEGNLIEDVIKDGEIALARYEYNCSGCGTILGMKRYKKSQKEYERSVTIVRQLQDLETKIRQIEHYEDHDGLLEGYEREIKRILGEIGNFQETIDSERELLEELASGKVQAYITMLAGNQYE